MARHPTRSPGTRTTSARSARRRRRWWRRCSSSPASDPGTWCTTSGATTGGCASRRRAIEAREGWAWRSIRGRWTRPDVWCATRRLRAPVAANNPSLPRRVAPASSSSCSRLTSQTPPSIAHRKSSQADEAGVASLVDIRLGNAVAEPLTDATVTFVYLLPKGNAKVSRKASCASSSLALGHHVRVSTARGTLGRAPRARRGDQEHARPRFRGRRRQRVQQDLRVPRLEFKPAWCRENPGDGDDRGDRDAGGAGETPG